MKYIIFVSCLFSGLFAENVSSLSFHQKHTSKFYNNNYLDFLSKKNNNNLNYLDFLSKQSKNKENIKINKKACFNDDEWPENNDDELPELSENNDDELPENNNEDENNNMQNKRRAIIFPGPNGQMNIFIPDDNNDSSHLSPYERYIQERNGNNNKKINKKDLKSENFEVIFNNNFNFSNVGGYDNVKEELMQCSDLLINYQKYSNYNVRTPKGVILEGPPGNGKTLLAKGFSGQINASFISTSGSIFQEKYVGVGSSRMRELFELALKAKPCIIFIDEIDAIGRKRGISDSSSDTERDNTLNQLLTLLDGFEDSNGVFLMCATNRIDLLDSALLRPGRIDKKIFISNPDRTTREEILNIHLKGKSHDRKVTMDMLLEMTNGLSGAEIENLLNEAMLKTLREDRYTITTDDLEYVLSRTLVGFQANKNIFSPNMIERIAMHELGHGIIGMLLTSHPKMTSINLNLWSPSSPGYTVFETEEIDANIFTKEKLFGHLVVLLSGRCAEQFFFNDSVTTGASRDFEEAYKLAERMITVYGMGDKTFYASSSDKSKQVIDNEVTKLLERAEAKSKEIIMDSKNLFNYLKPLLIKKQNIRREEIEKIINTNFPYFIYKKYEI